MNIIYTLSHPLTNEIRYVGYTSKPLTERLRRHLDRAKNSNDKYYSLQWIRSLLKNNLIPIIEELEICEIKNWQECEKFWISQLRSWGFNLTNFSLGGNGNPFMNQETKDKIRSANTGRKLSQQTKNKISLSHKGKKATKEAKKKMSISRKGEKNSMFGKHLSEETKKKLSESKKGIPLTEEHKKKLSQAFSGDKHPLYKKKRSQSTKEKISNAHKGKILSQETKVKLSIANKGKNNPRYGIRLSDELKEKIKSKIPSKPVVQLTKDGKIINKFISCKEANRQTGIDISSISKCCVGKVKSAGKYIWQWDKNN